MVFCRKNGWLFLSGVMALLVVFFVRLSMLQKSDEPAGLDGYYYALQAKSLVQTGQLENPGFESGFYLCALSSAICADAILGCKIWASIASALFCLGCGLLTYFVCKNFFAAVLVFLLSAVSPSAVTLSINYINNLTGLVFFCFFAVCVYSLFEKNHDFGKRKTAVLLILAFIFLALCFFTHLVPFVYCLAFVFALFMAKGGFSKKKVAVFLKSAKGKVIFGAAVLLFALAFIFLAIHEKARFSSMFSFGPCVPLFSDFMKNRISFALCIEQSVCFVLVWVCFLMFVIRSKNKLSSIPLILIPLVLFFPFWNLDVLDMGYRLFLSGSSVTPLVLALMIGKNWNRFSFLLPKILVASLLFAALLFWTKGLYDIRKNPPYKYYRSVVSDIELDDDSLLIAHLGLNHVYTYYKNLRWALNYLPDFPVARQKLWRLAYGADEDQVMAVFDSKESAYMEGLVRQIDHNYILVREDVWQEYLLREDEAIAQTYLNWFNPHSYRPSFIR